jgi:hypothetical protein
MYVVRKRQVLHCLLASQGLYSVNLIIPRIMSDVNFPRICPHYESRIITSHYATSRKVAGSIPDEVGFLNYPNPSSRTMSLASTQTLTEMSTRNLPGA